MEAESASSTVSNAVQQAALLAAVGLLIIATLFWQNVHLVSRFTTIFVDRSAAIEACMTANTMNSNLPQVPSYRIGSTQVFSPEYYEQQNARSSASAARNAELRERHIRMRVAAERSRDLELANARNRDQVLKVCGEKRYAIN
jgi:hypothetical protein